MKLRIRYLDFENIIEISQFSTLNILKKIIKEKVFYKYIHKQLNIVQPIIIKKNGYIIRNYRVYNYKIIKQIENTGIKNNDTLFIEIYNPNDLYELIVYKILNYRWNH